MIIDALKQFAKKAIEKGFTDSKDAWGFLIQLNENFKNDKIAQDLFPLVFETAIEAENKNETMLNNNK